MTPPLRILILDDSSDDAMLLVREVRKQYPELVYSQIDCAEDLEQSLADGPWDAIISDYMMPGFGGAKALENFKRHEMDIPFILVSGAIGEEAAVACMKAGAHDFIKKDNLSRLVPALERELRDAEVRRAHRASERELQEASKRLECLFKSAPVAIIALDREYRVKTWNPAAERIFGWEAWEVQDKVYPIVPEERWSEFLRNFEQNMAGFALNNYETYGQRKDGARVDFSVSTAPLSTEDGSIIGLTAFIVDITEHKRLQERLRQAQKMEAIGLLAGGVAHDFNNLLQVIIGNVQLVLRRLSPDDRFYEEISEVHHAGERAADLTRQLLAFSRRQIIKPVDMDLNEEIDKMLKMLRRVIGEDIEIEFIPGHRLGLISADQGQIEQVMMNLCVNARDAMPQGGRITIETEAVIIDSAYAQSHPWVTEQGRYVLLSISDTGCGMNEEMQRQIFDPFFTTKEVGKGTGLGLSTVYGIVKQHQGYIHVYSELGQGTTFKIYLPIVERYAKDVEKKIESLPPTGHETIMVVEDDEMVMKLVTSVLIKAGYTVLSARDGQDAVKVFKEHAEKVDLILMDIVLPKMNGREVQQQICGMSDKVRVLFTSGYTSNSVHTNFILDEGIHFLQKPYDPDELLRKIRDVLDGGLGKS